MDAMEFYCSPCASEWVGRGSGEPRQCPRCWGRVFLSEDEGRLASVALIPLAYLGLGEAPGVPSPATALMVPLGLITLTRVMGRAKTQGQRQDLARVILKHGGFDAARAEESAARLYPE